MRRGGRVLLAALVGVLALPATQAFAHAGFVGSDPADGSVIQAAPAFATLRFSEEVLLDASSVTLIHLGPGTTQDLTLVAVDGGATLHATLPTLERGAYLLRFVVVDPADLHQTVGTVSFGVGMDAPPSATGSQRSGSWWSIGLRAVTDASLVVGVGVTLVMLMVTRRRDLLPRRAPPLAVISAALVSVGWILLFVVDVGSVGFRHARWLDLLVASDPGRRALIGVELAAGTWWAARRLRHATTTSRAVLARVLLALELGFLVLAAIGGHAGVGGSSVVGTLLRFAHFASFCGWIGAVVVLWWVARDEPSLAELWPDTSRIAAYGLALTGVSGLLLSVRVVSTVTALLGTGYGLAIIGKMAVLVLLATVGALAARRVARGGSPRGIPVELVLVGVALVLAGFLAGGAPAVGARFDPLPIAVPQIVTRDAADLTVTSLLQPARPGPNLVRVSILETRRPARGVVDAVTMTLTRADGTVVASRAGVPPESGVLEWADVAIDSPGVYQLAVHVDRPASSVPEISGSWSVEPRPVPRAATVVSNRRWAAVALPLGGGWIALVVVGGWTLRGRRRQGSKRYPFARTVTR